MSAAAEAAAAGTGAGTGPSGSGQRAIHSTDCPPATHIGWSRLADTDPAAQIFLNAKAAALAALNALGAAEPVARVDYHSQGRLLVIADSSRAAQAVEALSGSLSIAVLWTGGSVAPSWPDVDVMAASLVGLQGYLGAFELGFQPPGSEAKLATFDLVLDLRREPAFRMHQPPQGYFHAADSDTFARAIDELPQMIGDFEKPKFFAYKESLCAHSRSRKTGCNQCIDVCSTQAITSAGDAVRVDPYLCMGCGACATVCPSGAMTYQYPRMADRGSQLKTMLNAWRLAAKGEGDAPVILIHNATDGRDSLAALLAGGADGLPANVLPLESWHVASTGVDLMLGAIAFGAGHVAVLAAGSEAPEYLAALRREMALGQSILTQLGYRGMHFSLVTSAAAPPSAGPGMTVPVPAGFNLSNDKRGTLEFVVEHLLRHAPAKQELITLNAGSPFGAIAVDKEKCTLCMSCAGACPESALMDGGEEPKLKFLERNCVQCGLCVNTCPENAIRLVPRLLLTAQRKQQVVLNESEPFHCISCGEALGTRLMIDTMLSRLTGHSMFQGEYQLKRLQMCADCRVVDMMSNKHEASILTGRPIE